MDKPHEPTPGPPARIVNIERVSATVTQREEEEEQSLAADAAADEEYGLWVGIILSYQSFVLVYDDTVH